MAAGTSIADAYSQAAASMAEAGIAGLDGRTTSGSTGTSSSKGSASSTGKTGGISFSGGGNVAPTVGVTSSGGGSVSASNATASGSGRGIAGVTGSGGVTVSPSNSVSFSGDGGRTGLGVSSISDASVSPSGIGIVGGGLKGAIDGTATTGMMPTMADRQAYEYGRAAYTLSQAGVQDLSGTRTFNPLLGDFLGTAGTATKTTGYGPVVGVVDAGRGWTQVQYADGTVETRRGDRASRNNNPGNIEYGSFAKRNGAVGSDGRFAVFPSREAGLKAQGELLSGPNYRDLTISQAITKYAPPSENNSSSYARRAAAAAGVSVDTKISDLSADQMTRMMEGMHSVEGNTGYRSDLPNGGQQQQQVAQSFRTLPDTFTPNTLQASTGGPKTDATVTTIAGAQAIANTSQRFENTYLAGNDTNTPSQSRPLGQQIASGAIDIGLGMVPGIGLAAGLVNAGAQLSGNRTIGQSIVDSVLGNRVANGAADIQLASAYQGDGPTPEELLQKTPAETSAPVQEFVTKYLSSPQDDVDRPTPAEKWGNRDRYGMTEYA